jgi:hypothetical protein
MRVVRLDTLPKEDSRQPSSIEVPMRRIGRAVSL